MAKPIFIVFLLMLLVITTIGFAEKKDKHASLKELPLLSPGQDEVTLRRRVEDLVAIVGYLSRVESKFQDLDVKLKKIENLKNSPLTNATARTLAMIRTLRSIYGEWGGKIDPSVGRGRFDFRNLYDPDYFKRLSEGLENYGYQDVSGKSLGLGVNFFLSTFPENVRFLESGEYRGFFQVKNGDLIVPGLRFYSEVLSRQRKSPCISGDGAMEPNIEEARKAIKILKNMFGEDNPALNLAALALEQPDFTGIVGEEGCVVQFDEKGIPMRAITTRVYDYKTGQYVRNRQLTDQELQQAAPSLKAYYMGLRSKGTIARTIVILSNSFKAAASEAVMGMAQEREYFLKREGRVAKMYKIEHDQAKLIAAEEIFYEK